MLKFLAIAQEPSAALRWNLELSKNLWERNELEFRLIPTTGRAFDGQPDRCVVIMHLKRRSDKIKSSRAPEGAFALLEDVQNVHARCVFVMDPARRPRSIFSQIETD